MLRESDLANAGILRDWHQRQLSTPTPCMGGTRADLILTVALGLWATSLQPQEIINNRTAAFVDAVKNRHFENAMPFVKQAIANLKALDPPSENPAS